MLMQKCFLLNPLSGLEKKSYIFFESLNCLIEVDWRGGEKRRNRTCLVVKSRKYFLGIRVREREVVKEKLIKKKKSWEGGRDYFLNFFNYGNYKTGGKCLIDAWTDCSCLLGILNFSDP